MEANWRGSEHGSECSAGLNVFVHRLLCTTSYTFTDATV